jgi:hypothetical protein
LLWDYINGKLFAVCCKGRLATYKNRRKKNVSGIILTPCRWWRDGEEIDRTL